MRSRVLWLTPIICAALLLPAPVRPLAAQSRAALALAGLVTSAEEGPMEGVLVSAKKNGSTITTTVVSDRDGRYRFPGSRLEAGDYTLRIRAAGYELAGPATATVSTQKAATVDLPLQK